MTRPLITREQNNYIRGNKKFNELMSHGMLMFLNQGNNKYWPKNFTLEVSPPVDETAILRQALLMQKNLSQLRTAFNNILEEVDLRILNRVRKKVISDIAAKICELYQAFDAELAQTISIRLFAEYCAACKVRRRQQFGLNTSDISDILYESSFLYIYKKCLKGELVKEEPDIKEFQKRLADLLTPLIKKQYGDDTKDDYRFTLHKVANFYKNEKNWNDFLAGIPPTATTLDLSDITWDFGLTVKQLSTIPKNITQLIFPSDGYWRSGDNPREAAAYLSFLPPHIKKIKINFSFHEPHWSSDEPSTIEKIRSIVQLLPCTLEEGCISDLDFGSRPRPSFPASYMEVFTTGMELPESQLPPISAGMKELLKYYLGTDKRSKREFFTTLWRCKGRDHYQHVEDIINRIGRDLIKPEDILYALKLLLPKNAKGGLQLRIHFFQDLLEQSLNQADYSRGETLAVASSSGPIS